ncbi:amidohydrolase family protein [Reichenbachiella carrageenanivorans]|uniref:Amidohydrolase family protein n=1 Tax=Reichenbachiella carrageenanivorans TaxID=2979869 RepID=A0ABY6D2L2_9BACT|nr:amidohydrolase family protein [Reichenbachiella carrageenanivorans]UXX79860.1 amidohydrolase family protein [Reichenbachiella carrageenanivorans]
MKVIDSHQHFWEYDPVRDSWISDDMAVLKRDFMPIDLAVELKANKIDGCIAVQADQSDKETMFLLQQAEKNDLVKGVVGWVDLQAVDIENQLKNYSKYKKLLGFRHIVQGEPDPDFMLGTKFQNGLAQLHRYGFTYDILVYPSQLQAAIETVKRHPQQKFVIDHMAKPAIKAGEIEEWKACMKVLGSYANVWCKVSGLVTEADWSSWKYEDLVSYLDVVVLAFGMDRVMYGSDWPVCLLAAEYSEVRGIVDRYFNKYSKTEKGKFFGLNAMEFYGID